MYWNASEIHRSWFPRDLANEESPYRTSPIAWPLFACLSGSLALGVRSSTPARFDEELRQIFARNSGSFLGNGELPGQLKSFLQPGH